MQMMMAPAMHRPLMLSLSLQSPNKMGARKRRRVMSVPYQIWCRLRVNFRVLEIQNEWRDLLLS